jgi:hypothetical protein
VAEDLIEFSCQHCASPIGVARGLAGATIRCPSCGQPTAVPPEPAAVPEPEPRPEVQPAPAAATEAPWWMTSSHPPQAPGPFAGLPPPPGVAIQQSDSSALATASLVLGILSIVPLLCVGWVSGVPAIILGAMALQRGQPRALAIAGIVTGGIGTLVGALFTAVLAIPWLVAALQGNT